MFSQFAGYCALIIIWLIRAFIYLFGLYKPFFVLTVDKLMLYANKTLDKIIFICYTGVNSTRKVLFTAH